MRHAPQRWVDQQFYSIITDLVGSPAELINDQGGVAWFHRTTLWGNTLDHSRTGAYTPLRFPGQYADPETGLNYNFHRHYDPATGRYGSGDPLGLAAGPNPHRYVENPHEAVDPLGLKDCSRPAHFERAKENMHTSDSLDQARADAIKFSGMEGDTVPHVQKLGPWQGFNSGEMTPDGKRGWRLDWDDHKGVHVNWWDHSEGRKRPSWWYGANQVPGASYDDYMKALEGLN